MDNTTLFFAPALSIMLLFIVANKIVTLWQEEKSWNVFFSLMVYACMCLLYVVALTGTNRISRDVVRIILLLCLAGKAYFDWKKTFFFIRVKERTGIAPIIGAVTIADMETKGGNHPEMISSIHEILTPPRASATLGELSDAQDDKSTASETLVATTES